MPSRDPETGRRISGAGQRRRKKTNGTPTNPFHEVPAPPFAEAHKDGPSVVECWAASVAAVALRAAEAHRDVPRVVWITRALRRLGQLQNRARHSFKAAQILDVYEGARVDLFGEVPPMQPVTLVAWAYFRLACAIHCAATAPTWDDAVAAHWQSVVEAAAAMGCLPQVQGIRELTARLRAEAEDASPRT